MTFIQLLVIEKKILKLDLINFLENTLMGYKLSKMNFTNESEIKNSQLGYDFIEKDKGFRILLYIIGKNKMNLNEYQLAKIVAQKYKTNVLIDPIDMDKKYDWYMVDYKGEMFGVYELDNDFEEDYVFVDYESKIKLNG